MLIVSKFHDYYDTVMSQGVDKGTVYLRETREIDPDKHRRGYYFTEGKKGRRFEVGSGVVGFCGELYPFVAFEEYSQPTRYVYNEDAFQAAIFELGIATKDKRWSWGESKDMLDNKARPKHFDVGNHKALLPLFQEHKVPVFMKVSETLTLNPRLKTLGFQRIKDPFTAFQDVYMYVSGVIGSDRPVPVELTDEERAAKKGHDGKYSFRKPPGGGRWR